MVSRESYRPGPADAGEVKKEGESWTLVLTKELCHSPDRVWQALTDPEELREWAPFDSDQNMGTAGKTVQITGVGTGSPYACETVVTRADAPHVLEYNYGGDLRWELEATEQGTRLRLWHKIDRRFISMGAAGWQICLDVLERQLDGQPIGRMVGNEALQFEGWQRLNREYAAKFGIEAPKW